MGLRACHIILGSRKLQDRRTKHREAFLVWALSLTHLTITTHDFLRNLRICGKSWDMRGPQVPANSVIEPPCGSAPKHASCFTMRIRFMWEFPQIRGTILGDPIIRTIVFWGLYWVPLFGETTMSTMCRIGRGTDGRKWNVASTGSCVSEMLCTLSSPPSLGNCYWCVSMQLARGDF